MNFFIKQRLAYGHKIPLNIKFKNVAIFGIVAGTGANEVVNTPYTIMCSFPYTATVTVIDKRLFKNGRYVLIYKMVNYPVPEIGSKNLPLYRFVNYKTDATAGFVVAVHYFIGKSKQIGFKMLFKCKRIYGVAFVFPGIKICLKQIQYDFLPVCKGEQFRF